MSSEQYIEITEKEVIEEFYNQLSEPLSNLFSDIKEKMFRNGNHILNVPNKTSNNDFLELILYNIKLEQLNTYVKKNVY
jgi:hypothetical protein